MDLEHARQQFPALKEKVFQDAACVSLAPRRAVEAIEEFLKVLGTKVVTPEDPRYRSGIVTFNIGSSGDNILLMNKLLERKILTSVRYTSDVGGIRVSCHFFNNISDLECLLEGVKECMKKV